jgi:hypothetical protein
MPIRKNRGFGCLLLHLFAALTVGAAGVGYDEYREQIAVQMLRRVGGAFLVESAWGRSMIVQANLSGKAPTADDLAALVPLRCLRVVDLSFSHIGDRELLALVHSRAQLIVVPDGRTSRRARQQFAEGRLAIGHGPMRAERPAPADGDKPYWEDDEQGVEQNVVADEEEPRRRPIGRVFRDANQKTLLRG